MAGRKSGSKDVAPMVRGAFKRALAQCAAEGKPLSTMIKDSLEQDFLNTMRVIASYTPKELEQTIEHRRAADELTDEELERIATGSGAAIAPEAESPQELH